MVCSRDSAAAISEAISRWRCCSSATRCSAASPCSRAHARAIALRRGFGFVARARALALVEARARLFGLLRVHVALAVREGVLAPEPLDLGARGGDLGAPLGFVGGLFGGQRFDRAQLLVDRVERAARIGDRGRRGQLALARAVDLGAQRRQALVERFDLLAQA